MCLDTFLISFFRKNSYKWDYLVKYGLFLMFVVFAEDLSSKSCTVIKAISSHFWEHHFYSSSPTLWFAFFLIFYMLNSKAISLRISSWQCEWNFLEKPCALSYQVMMWMLFYNFCIWGILFRCDQWIYSILDISKKKKRTPDFGLLLWRKLFLQI